MDSIRSTSGTDLSELVAEADELVERLQRGLAALDTSPQKEPSPAVINEIFRSVHTLKGLAGLFEADDLASLAHRFEDLLQALRLGRVVLSGSVQQILYDGGEMFATVLGSWRSGAPIDTEALSDLARRLHEATTAATVEVAPDALDLPPGFLDVLTEFEEHRLRASLNAKVPLYLVQALLPRETFDEGLAVLHRQLTDGGEVLTTLPCRTDRTGYIRFQLLVATRAALADWLEPLTETEGEITVEAVGSRAERSAQPSAPDVEEATPAGSEQAVHAEIGESIRVDVRRIGELMGMAAELSLLRSEMQRDIVDVRDGLEGPALVQRLEKRTRALERRVAELQQGIMRIRMVPMRLVFDRLRRTVRRLGREMGKQVRLEVTGEETELDKFIVEALSDPLLHLVRNSLDHGIENEAQRSRQGKPPTGLLALRAFSRGRHVVIEVEDDGAGLEEEAIRRAARRQGLVESETLDGLSRREVWNLIFLPGFSTREEATDLSGRGIGMDVVKTNIGQLSGVIDVRSVRGHGTCFSITLPITLAIVPALIVEVVGRTFALPLSSVQEIRTLEPSAIHAEEGREHLIGDGESIPLIDLGRAFELTPSADPPGPRYVAIVGLAQERMGLVVDNLLGQLDVIVKPLGRLLRKVRGVSGAADIGTGALILVLDVGELIGNALHPSSTALAAQGD